MNILREDVDALNAVLKVQISPEDYQSKVKNELEKYRKSAKVPGFRPGHVPVGLIQKQYGKSVLAETLNKTQNILTERKKQLAKQLESRTEKYQRRFVDVLVESVKNENKDAKPSVKVYDKNIKINEDVNNMINDINKMLDE